MNAPPPRANLSPLIRRHPSSPPPIFPLKSQPNPPTAPDHTPSIPVSLREDSLVTEGRPPSAALSVRTARIPLHAEQRPHVHRLHGQRLAPVVTVRAPAVRDLRCDRRGIRSHPARRDKHTHVPRPNRANAVRQRSAWSMQAKRTIVCRRGRTGGARRVRQEILRVITAGRELRAALREIDVRCTRNGEGTPRTVSAIRTAMRVATVVRSAPS